MNLRTASASLGLSVLLCPLVLAQVVTDTKWVESWEEKGTPREQLRKINGRWWTQDNREVTPPGKGGGFWTIDSKPGTCTFYHHRPIQLSRAESLHLFMGREQVEALLGEPNRTLGDDRGRGWHGFWWYYASDGTKLSVRFMGEDGLGEAKYEYLHEKSRSVASVESDLGGRDIYKVMADRAWKKNQEQSAIKMSNFRASHSGRSGQPSTVNLTPVPVAPADPTPPKRIVSAQAYSNVTVGATRDDVLTRLGEPNSRYAITDDDGTHESFTYDLDNGEAVVIRLLGGKVTKVR
jgi:outer membrane protein assembly factor BamE (lipoprotein component of BamABCDE complex)